MRFNHWSLGQRESGDVLVVYLPDNAANACLRLLDDANFQSRETGRRYRYYGGPITDSPSEIPIPHHGDWHAVVELPDGDGQSRSAITVDLRVVPSAARQPLPRYQPPSLAPIAQAAAEAEADTTPAHHGIDNVPAPKHDVFISHSHAADQDEVAQPLAVALGEQGLSVWDDDFVLGAGDSLRRKIDAGIAQCRFGIIVLSEDFFAHQWTQYELDRIVTLPATGKQGILPIWHKLTKDEVIAQSPLLADAIARNTTESTIDELAAEIASVIHDQKRRTAAGAGPIADAVRTG